MKFVFLFLFVIATMQIYFFIARRFDIVDRPNNRSSHSRPTIRGAGVVFLFGWLFWFLLDGYPLPYFAVGVFVIACISFIDDLKTQPAGLRLLMHVLAFSMMCWQLSLFALGPWWLVLTIFVVGIGAVNAFNFMDGINGMLGLYGLVALLSLLAINRWLIDFIDERMIVVIIISIAAFLFYNFRKNARCFAGDVGSVTMAFILGFLVLRLMLASGDFGWFILFAAYGVDTVGTIIYRLINRENIFTAHRSHLYQYLANELALSHLLVSVGYATVQIIINVFFIIYFPHPTFAHAIFLVLLIGVVYVVARERIMASIGKRGILSTVFNSGINKR